VNASSWSIAPRASSLSSVSNDSISRAASQRVRLLIRFE
jgi:hypothetical protein